ncbi:MAG: hypothetical protein CL936_06680 [Deltaproteobacteria bacterium]|nr:hypothetical protein [Deltaproteobacteria bacterium]
MVSRVGWVTIGRLISFAKGWGRAGMLALMVRTQEKGPHGLQASRRFRCSPLGLLATIGLFSALGAGTPPHDPVQVFYPQGECETGVLEIELWNRTLKAWRPHPDHPRVMANTCQTEDAGDLLNEIRVRCADPANAARGSSWVTGVQVYEPSGAPGCQGPNFSLRRPNSPRITLTAPRADRPVSEPNRTPALRGQVELTHDVVVLVDQTLFTSLAASEVEPGRGPRLTPEQLMQTLEKAIGGALDLEGPLRLAWIPFADRGAARPPVARQPVPLLSDSAGWRAESRILDQKGAAAPSWVSGLDQAMASLGATQAPEARQTILSILDAAAAYPLGRAAGSSPGHRQRVLSAVERAAQSGIALEFLVIGAPERDLPELAGQVRAKIRSAGSGGSVAAIPDSEALTPSVLALRVLSLREVRVENLTTGGVADPLEWDASGQFKGRIPLQAGRNLLRVRARLSGGEELTADFERGFDPSALRQKLRAEERARIERARLGELSIKVEERR